MDARERDGGAESMLRRTVAAMLLVALAGTAGRLDARSPDRVRTVSGTVAKIEATERAVTLTLPDGSPERYFWTNDTKFSGVLSPGARVTIRYAVSSDGRNLAQQISVSRS